jgi:hypothetical protein
MLGGEDRKRENGVVLQEKAWRVRFALHHPQDSETKERRVGEKVGKEAS